MTFGDGTRMRRLRHVGLFVAAALVAQATVAAPAVAVTADAVEIVTLDGRDRERPREVGILGESSLGIHVLLEDRSAPGSTQILTGSGLEHAEFDHWDLVGDRMVGEVDDEWTLPSRVGGQPVEYTDIPQYWDYLAPTSAGVLLEWRDLLYVLPWAGGEPRLISSVPEVGYSVQVVDSDERGVLISGDFESGTDPDTSIEAGYYIDTDSLESWPIEYNRDATLSEQHIAWAELSNGVVSLVSVPRPSAGEQWGAESSRPAPDYPRQYVGGIYRQIAVAVVGDDFVVYRNDIGMYNWEADDVAPVFVTDPAGNSTLLAQWGHGVTSGIDDSVLLVGGNSSSDFALLRYSSAGITELAPIPRVRATASAIAIDESTVYTSDNSSDDGAIVKAAVDFETTTAGSGAIIATGARDVYCSSSYLCSELVAGDGGVTWKRTNNPYVANIVNGGAETRLSWDSHQELFAATGSHSVSNRVLTDFSSKQAETLRSTNADAASGVFAQPGTAFLTSPSSISLRDLSSGSSSFVQAPSICTTVRGVQLAGSWFLLYCQTETGLAWVVVDRSGEREPVVIDDSRRQLRLGNGFITSTSTTGILSWADLASGASEWHELGETFGSLGTVAVSHGSTPTVAWVDREYVVRAARLPVTTTTMPSVSPGATSVPTKPTIAMVQTDGGVDFSWPAPAASERVTGYVIYNDRETKPRIADAAATSFTWNGLYPGVNYSFTIYAQNAKGNSIGVSKAFRHVSSAPASVEFTAANLSHDTDTVTASWTYNPTANHDPAVSFTLRVGSIEVSGIPATARTASLESSVARVGDTVTLVAVGANGSRTVERLLTSDDDLVSPTAAISGLSEVTLGSRLAFGVAASDDRGVVSTDVRLRSSASATTAIGAWTYPASWQNLGPAPTLNPVAKAGATYCVSARSRDARGNVSAWSQQKCTAVALDDRALTRSGSIRLISHSEYYKSTASATVTASSALSTPVRAQTMYIVATRCSTCGAVGVRVGTMTMKVNLTTPNRHPRSVIKVQWDANVTGTVSIVRWGNKNARIDGFAVLGR